MYVESSFFERWWLEQNERRQDQVKQLVSEGRLEFAGGAWSMNDEAAVHYQSVVDHLTWGLRSVKFFTFIQMQLFTLSFTYHKDCSTIHLANVVGPKPVGK